MNESKDIFAINLRSAAKGVLKYWHIIIGFVVILLIGTYFYISVSSTTYNVGASILLRVDQNKGSTNAPEFIRAFNLHLTDRSFHNEIFFLQSFPLIREVVQEMDIRTSYYLQRDGIPKRFAWSLQNAYNDSPIIVVPKEGRPQPINLLFWVDVIDDERYRIHTEGKNIALLDFENERVAGRAASLRLSGVYRFGEMIENEHAAFRILLNSNYNPEVLKDKDLFFKFNNLNQVAGEFKRALKVESQGVQSTVVHLRFTTENRALGLNFLNKLVETYIRENMDESNLLANQTIEHIERQLENISDDLSFSESQLQTLRSTRSVMSVEDKSRRIYDQLQIAQSRRDEVQRRLNHLTQMDEYFVLYKDSARILAPSSIGLNDPVLNNLIQQLTTLNAEKQQIISQDQLRNPRLSTLNISIDNLKNVINENITFSLETSRNELNELNSRLENLNREFSRLPQTQRELIGVERQFKLNDATYTSLLERRIHAQIVKASTLPDAKIIEYPSYLGVASPQRSLLYGLAVFLGLLIPSGFIIVKDLLENRIKRKADVGLFTNLPIVASIPHVKNPSENLVLNNSKSPLAESYFMLRSDLVYYLKGEKNKTILVTSSMPKEGKSYTAFNLAASFAMSNNKTVLLEFDLRKLSNTLNGVNTQGLPGVSSYLINKAKLEEITIRTKLPDLDIIHSGQIPPNPIGLLSGSKTHELMEELKKKYDYIIVDTPPYGLLSDSFMLMNYADINLFVSRLDHTRKDLFAANLDDLQKKNIENVYIVLNGDNEKMRTYGYEKYYSISKKTKLRGLLRKKVAVY